MIYALIVLLIVLAVVYSVTIHAFNKMTLDKRMTLEEGFNYLQKKGLYSREEFEELPREEIEIKSKDGLKLKGVFIENFKDNKKVMIIVHGYTVVHVYALQFVNMFLKEGFNVLLIDQRSHGKSEGKYATYGYHEKYDLDLWVSWVRQRIGKDAVIGLHGQSMGGGTVLEYAGINKYVRFIIADCPYSDMRKLMKHQFNKLNHIPMIPFIYLVNMRLKRLAKFSIKDVSPINAIKDKEIPIFFIHGSEDDYVPTHMSKDMYKVKKGYKKLLIVEGAVHANAYSTDKELYEREVHNFLEDVLG
jgi:fermentation-respiration switch protein FrsA (DUF1100 family)